MARNFEQIIAFHCAPALVGMKPSNLVSFSKERYPYLTGQVEEYNRLLNKRDIYFHLICESEQRFLLLVYRKKSLTSHLETGAVAQELKKNGYPVDQGLQAALEHLQRRFEGDAGFPHEVGLFLGYPVEDVLGFIENRGRNYQLNGHWKVYANVEQTEMLFQRYEKCRETLYTRVANGMSIVQIFSAA